MFATLSRAAAKSAASRLRKVGVLRTQANWAARAAVCRDCPLRAVVNGVPHCGKPLLRQIHRSPADGCGCPIEAKARTPGEHCPLNGVADPSTVTADGCDCRWCAALGTEAETARAD